MWARRAAVRLRALLVAALFAACTPHPQEHTDAGLQPSDSGVPVDSGVPDAGELPDAGRLWNTEDAESTDALCSNTLDDDTSS